MGKEEQIFEAGLKHPRHVKWAAIEKDEKCESRESSSINDSEGSSVDLADDASSSYPPSNSSPSRGPLYEMAELMAQLPIKRRLSKYYHGKSRTFASLASVVSVEDLAKKEITCYSKTMKSCKGYGGNFNHQHKFGPRATIRKRSPKGSVISASLATKGAMVVN